MNTNLTSTQTKFLSTHPAWVYWVRKPIFNIASFIILFVYAAFLLPKIGAQTIPQYIIIFLFIALVLAWSGNILADQGKPELLKGLVAFGLIAIFCWLFYLYSGAQWGKLEKNFFNWGKMVGSWNYLFQGLLVTLELAALSAVFSVIIGLFVAILRSLGSRTLNLFLIGYIDAFRSVPMIVIMVVIFFALPYVGINLGSIATTVVALSLGYGAYASESFRAGIESVHVGQLEAARALGLSRWKTMRMIILPQAIPVVIPPLTGILVSMLKDTAVASLVASPELLKKARELYTSKANPTPLVAVSFIYLAVLIPLVRIANMLERRYKKI